MGIIQRMLTEMIFFSIVWKTGTQLCPQKKLREYANALLGVILILFLFEMIYTCFPVKYLSQLRENLTIWDEEISSFSDLFTEQLEVKTKLDNIENEEENSAQTLEKTGISENEEEQKNNRIRVRLQEKSKISTVHVENIQSINIDY